MKLQMKGYFRLSLSPTYHVEILRITACNVPVLTIERICGTLRRKAPEMIA